MNDFTTFAQLALLDHGFGLVHVGVVLLYLAALRLAIRVANPRTAGTGASQECSEGHEDLRLRVLEGVHGTSKLDHALERLAEYVEGAQGTQQRIRCCVLLVESDGDRPRVAAAPSLPAVFKEALERSGIAEAASLSRSGVWHLIPSLVPDMLVHPGYEALGPAAKAAGLRSCWTVPIRDTAGKPLGIVAAFGERPILPTRAEMVLLHEASRLAAIDIERRIATARLQARERDLRTLVDRSPDSITRYDAQCRLICANAQALREAGLQESDLVGRTPAEFPGGESARTYQATIAKVLANGGSEEFELDWMNATGELRYSHIRLEPEYDSHGCVTRVLAVGRDVTRIVEYRKKLHELAYVDALTGLPNRARLKDLLRTAVSDAARQGLGATLIVLGLDRFKAVNDTFGRDSGDALLRATSRRLCRSLDPSCVVARLEGDEFAILMPTTEGDRDAVATTPRILETLATPFHVGNLEIRLTASLGVAHAPDHGVEAEELLRCAAMALHHAKHEGRNRAHRYAPELTAAAQERLALEADLRKAAAAGDFELYYQPKVDLGTGSVVGAEALLRWHHPQRGLVTPASFIALAEESGLITELGEWALRGACQAGRRWNERTGRVCPVAVNLSPRQFIDGRLAERVQRVFAETGCRPEWVELEITESLLLDDRPEIRQTLETLADLGVSLAVDDFGTGYSALAYLARFPIHTLKIDRSFISGMIREPDSAELVRAIAAMARSLRMAVVAEGVESLEQADFLKGIGCHLAQGYLYGKPMPEDVFQALLVAPPLVHGLLEQAE